MERIEGCGQRRTFGSPVEKTVRDIRRKPHRQHSAEEKIWIVLSGLQGEKTGFRAQIWNSNSNRVGICD